MLELEAFVQSQETNPGQLSILPVYLGLSQNECTRNETRREHWLSLWRDWAKDDNRIDVGKWEAALKVLSPSNGLEYVESLGEVALREQIVSAVCRLIPPESSWSAGPVQGRTRILKTLDLLKRRIRQQQVFLAVDNVWQESLEQAKDFLRSSFHHGSLVMVTARSIDILGRLNIDESDCLEMPDLEEEDAKQLFLHSAAPHMSFMEEDEPKIQSCIGQCWFRKGANMEEHYHPLALKILGAALGSLGCDPSLWVENLVEDDKFNFFREKDHLIFNILRKGYDSLCEEDQLLFVDAILFHPSLQDDFGYPADFATKISIKHNIFSVDIFKWLSIVHNLREGSSIKGRLQALKAKSLIEDIGDGFNGVIVHDLYLDFAKSEVKRGALDARRWIWYDYEASYSTDLARRPSGNCWSNVEKISVKYVGESIRWMETLEGMKWQQFSNVVVLQLHVGLNVVLDLRGLQCLKSLELKWGYAEIDRYHEGGGKLIGLEELRNLAWLEMYNIRYAPCFQEIGHLTRLEVLRLGTNCDKESPSCEPPLEPPNLDKCIHLQELVLEWTCFVSFPDLSKLTSLRKVLFCGCKAAKEVVGLSSQTTSLQELLLRDCKSLRQCPGLSDVVSLQELDVADCAQFSQFSQTLDLHKLTRLRRLKIVRTKLNKLLGLDGLMHLQELLVDDVDELPNLHLLKKLERVSMAGFRSLMMPRFDNFIALEELILNRLPEVRDIHGMRSLRRLKRLTISFAPNLLQLSELGDLMALQYLALYYCCSLIGNLDLSDLHKLINLEALEITRTPVRRLPPNLQRLTQLKVFGCSRSLLAELPVLSGLDKLEIIDLPNAVS